jgi:hypothetical protein
MKPHDHVYDPARPLSVITSSETGRPVKHSFKATSTNRVEHWTEVKVPIINSGAKGKAFLHFIYKFNHATAIMTCNNGDTLIKKSKMHLQGLYQMD